MSNQDEIRHQQELLTIYRRTLGHQLRRAGQYGGEVYAPPEVANGIYEARTQINRIKDWLRKQGVSVADELNDAPAAGTDSKPPIPTTPSSPTINFNGPTQIGNANLGGSQTIDKLEVTMGDSFNFTGATISNSILNVKSKLEHVNQSIGALPQANEAAKKTLEQLVAQLQTELQKAAEQGHADDAEKVSNRTDALIQEAAKSKPDKELIEFNSESLKKAAGNIAAVLPTVLTIATQIVQQIQKLVP